MGNKQYDAQFWSDAKDFLFDRCKFFLNILVLKKCKKETALNSLTQLKWVFFSGDKAKNRAKYFDIPSTTLNTYDGDIKQGGRDQVNNQSRAKSEGGQSIQPTEAGEETGGKLRNYFPWPQTSSGSGSQTSPVCKTLLTLVLHFAGISLVSIAIKRPF